MNEISDRDMLLVERWWKRRMVGGESFSRRVNGLLQVQSIENNGYHWAQILNQFSKAKKREMDWWVKTDHNHDESGVECNNVS